MSLPQRRPAARLEPRLAARLESPPGVPREIRRQAEFFVFFARTVFPLLETYRERLRAAVLPGQRATGVGSGPAAGGADLAVRPACGRPAGGGSGPVRSALAAGPASGRGQPPSTPRCWPSSATGWWKAAQEGLAFAAVLDYLVEQGWVPKRSRQRLDSTHVRGLLSVMSRLECVRETHAPAAGGTGGRRFAAGRLGRYWERYVESKLDPRAGAQALEAK